MTVFSYIEALVQSSAPPFRHRLSIAQRLRDNHGQPNRNDLSDKPSTEPGQLQLFSRMGLHLLFDAAYAWSLL